MFVFLIARFDAMEVDLDIDPCMGAADRPVHAGLGLLDAALQDTCLHGQSAQLRSAKRKCTLQYDASFASVNLLSRSTLGNSMKILHKSRHISGDFFIFSKIAVAYICISAKNARAYMKKKKMNDVCARVLSIKGARDSKTGCII